MSIALARQKLTSNVKEKIHVLDGQWIGFIIGFSPFCSCTQLPLVIIEVV